MPAEVIHERPEQFPETEIFNKEDRIVKGWGSVEVIDRDGDYLPMSEFKKVMPVIMKRGGVIIDRHSNRVVGKILNYEFKNKETVEGSKEGVLLTYQIFKDYETDDLVWEAIKGGVYKGLSFGGRNKLNISFKKDGINAIVLKGIEGFEFSVVDGMGNQESNNTHVNYFAKGKEEWKPYEGDDVTLKAYNEIMKPFAGFKDFNQCVVANKHLEDPAGYCAAIKNEVEKLVVTEEKTEENSNNETLNPHNSTTGTLMREGEFSKKFIKQENLSKSMSDEIKKKPVEKEVTEKQEDVPAEDQPQEETASVEERLTRLESLVQQMLDAMQGTQKDNSEKENDVEKEGQKTTLPKDVVEVIQDKDAKNPTGDEEKDKVHMVQKDELKKELMDEIKKELKLNGPGAETPRVNQDGMINKSNDQIAEPNNWAEANATVRKLAQTPRR